MDANRFAASNSRPSRSRQVILPFGSVRTIKPDDEFARLGQYPAVGSDDRPQRRVRPSHLMRTTH